MLEAAEAWAIATGARAGLLGAGRLAVGEPADFLLLRRDSYELGLGRHDAGLVYAASGSIVDTTVVAGRVLMRGRGGARRRGGARPHPGAGGAPRDR